MRSVLRVSAEVGPLAAGPLAVFTAGASSVVAAMLREHAAMPIPTDITATAIRDAYPTMFRTPRQLVDGILDVPFGLKLMDYKQLKSY
jgi:siroheme synthase (precorrin-2 oxidase/ferrochelatase)